MGHAQSHVEGGLAGLVGTTDDRQIEGELFVRSLAPFATYRTQERLIDRLNHLRSLGDLESISIRVWGDAVRTDGAIARAGDGETAADRITEFIARAGDASWSISRYFRVVTDDWMTADETMDGGTSTEETMDGGTTDGGVSEDRLEPGVATGGEEIDDWGTDGGQGSRIVPPRRCLSLREDGDLIAVFPCDVDGERYTPEDALTYLEAEG